MLAVVCSHALETITRGYCNLPQQVLAECEKGANRNVAAVVAWCDDAAALVATDAGLALSEASNSAAGDWRLVWASSDDALSVVGSGLHKVPLTLMEDLFLSFKPGSKADSRPSVRRAGLSASSQAFPRSFLSFTF